MPANRPVRIAVVADTHSDPHPNALGLIQRDKPDLILHAGDIGHLSVVKALSAVAETFAVRGNIDGRAKETPDHIVLDFKRDAVTELRILLTHIAVAGPRLRRDARELAKAQQAQIVVCGHSHVPLMAMDGKLAIFNPGSIGPRRFHLPIVFGVLEYGPKGLGLRHVNCETGEDWTPPNLKAHPSAS